MATSTDIKVSVTKMVLTKRPDADFLAALRYEASRRKKVGHSSCDWSGHSNAIYRGNGYKLRALMNKTSQDPRLNSKCVSCCLTVRTLGINGYKKQSMQISYYCCQDSSCDKIICSNCHDPATGLGSRPRQRKRARFADGTLMGH